VAICRFADVFKSQQNPINHTKLITNEIFIDRFYFFILYYSTNLEEVSCVVLKDSFSSKFHVSFPEIPKPNFKN